MSWQNTSSTSLSLNPLTPTTIQLNSVSNQAITCKGMAIVSIYVGAHKEDCLFHVTDNKESAHDIILGRAWLHKHRCQFDWEEHTINLAFGPMKITLPTAAEAIVTTAIPCANLIATALPTIPQKQRCAKPRVNNGIVTPNASIQKRWIPKKLLQAQHFYEGNDLIWVPKAKRNLVKKRQPQQVSMPPTSSNQQSLQRARPYPFTPKQIWGAKVYSPTRKGHSPEHRRHQKPMDCHTLTNITGKGPRQQ